MSLLETAAEDAAKTAVGGAATPALPWLLLGGAVLVAAACAASFYYGHHVESLAFDAYKSQQAAVAAKQEAANRAALLVQQQADQAKMDQINQEHAGETDEIVKRRDALLAANRSLTQRLWVRTHSTDSKPAVPEVGASEPVDAQGSSAALSDGSAKFFIDEFAAADQLAADYAALQQVITHDREVCNGSLPGVSPQ